MEVSFVLRKLLSKSRFYSVISHALISRPANKCVFKSHLRRSDSTARSWHKSGSEFQTVRTTTEKARMVPNVLRQNRDERLSWASWLITIVDSVPTKWPCCHPQIWCTAGKVCWPNKDAFTTEPCCQLLKESASTPRWGSGLVCALVVSL